MSEEPKKGGYLRQAWLVILLALCYGAALAGVQTTLGPIIAENKKNETFSQVPELVPGADGAKTLERTVMLKDKPQPVLQACDAEGETVGWVVPASGQGFADKIEILVGLDAKCETITGMYVLAQNETPALGDYIRDYKKFREQFEEKSALEPLKVVKTEPAPDTNEIKALSAATVSSEAVAKIVNESVAAVRPLILALPPEAPKAEDNNEE